MEMKDNFNKECHNLYCRKCGALLPEDSIYCHKCGTKVRTDMPCAPKSKKKSKALKIIFAVIVLIVSASAVAIHYKDYLKAALLYDVEIVSSQPIKLNIGGAQPIAYKTEPSGISRSEVEWSSSNYTVASVSSQGIITGKSEGTCVITASIQGIQKNSCSVEVSPKPVSIKNGQMIIEPKYTDNPEVTIHAPHNENCFVYFKDIRDKSNDFAFYVKAGSTVTVNAPTGIFDFYYATGKSWYGRSLKFGKDTRYYKSPDPMVLTEDETGYDILELTLYAVSNGNMDTRVIDEDEFPI